MKPIFGLGCAQFARGLSPVACAIVCARRTARSAGRSIRGHINSLQTIVRMPSVLVSSRTHPALLTRNRMSFVARRLGAVSIFLAAATIGWIPIDVFFFGIDDPGVPQLALGRVVAALFFFVMSGIRLRLHTERDGIAALVFTVAIGIGFFMFAHSVIAHGEDIAGPGHAQYLLMPIALVAGLSIFPLTLMEAALLTAAPLAALVIEIIWNDGAAALSQAGVGVLVMCAVAITTMTCSISQLKLLVDLHQQSTTDPLTGLLSRRAGIELLNVLFAESQRADTPLSLALLDLDRFKDVNDGFGHEAGDDVLRAVAAKLRAGLRRQDVVIRWGGEEMIVVLPGTRAAEAAPVLASFCDGGLAMRPDRSVQTASVGLAERRIDAAADWRQLVTSADQRMYAAKGAGRARLQAPQLPPIELGGTPRAAAA